jgi:hypothetical protein
MWLSSYSHIRIAGLLTSLAILLFFCVPHAYKRCYHCLTITIAR